METAKDLASIIILTHNNAPFTRQCLTSLRQYTDQPYEVIVVDNGSTDGFAQFLQSLSHPNMTVIVNRDNRGYAVACNQGLRVARGKILVLLNNDVILTPGWLHNLRACLASNSKIGMAGPLTNHITGSQCYPVKYQQIGVMQSFARRFNQSTPARWWPVKRLTGFCLALKREVINSVGYFDEGYALGNYEDDDLCMQVQRAGFTLMLAGDTFVHHYGSKTIQSLNTGMISAATTANRRRFMAKWGFDPLLNTLSGSREFRPPSGTIVTTPGGIYYIDFWMRRLLAPEHLTWLGRLREGVLRLSNPQLAALVDGPPLDPDCVSTGQAPSCLLVKDEQGTCHFLQRGFRRPIHQDCWLKLKLTCQRPVPVRAADLQGYPEGEPVLPSVLQGGWLPDRLVLRVHNHLLISEESTLRAIPMGLVHKCGLNHQAVMEANKTILDLYPIGPPVTLNNPPSAPASLIPPTGRTGAAAPMWHQPTPPTESNR